MRTSDYPAPSYAGLVWAANGRLWLSQPGKGTVYFEDSPDGLNELRTALLACGDARRPLGPARVSGSNLTLPAPPKKPSKRLGVRGRPKLDLADLWGED